MGVLTMETISFDSSTTVNTAVTANSTTNVNSTARRFFAAKRSASHHLDFHGTDLHMLQQAGWMGRMHRGLYRGTQYSRCQTSLISDPNIFVHHFNLFFSACRWLYRSTKVYVQRDEICQFLLLNVNHMTFFSFLDSYNLGICLYIIYTAVYNGYNGICWYLCKMGSIRIPAPFWLIRMVWSCSGKCRHRTCNPFIVLIHNLWSLAHVLQSSGWLIKVQASWCNICI